MAIDEYMLRKRNIVNVQCATEALDIKPHHRILEVGFGPGFGLQTALQYVQNGPGVVYGVDISDTVVSLARKAFDADLKKGKLFVTQGDVANLPYDGNFFDGIFHTNCYYFWPDMKGGISELKRVLKPGGLMTTTLTIKNLTDFDGKGFLKYGKWNPDPYMATLEEQGFVDVKMETKTIQVREISLISARKPDGN